MIYEQRQLYNYHTNNGGVKNVGPIHKKKKRCVHGREIECRPHNHKVPSSILGNGCQLWDFSLVHTFGASTGVVPRKQNRERLV